MPPNWLLLGVMLFAGAARAATDAVPPETLTAAEAERLAAARAAVLRSPALRTVNDAFKASRTAYRADRANFPADRDPTVATAFRRAKKDLDRAVHETLATDPGIAPLLAKRPRSRNTGETAADSDGVKNPAVAPIEDVAGLPRVLLIGDSISIGYTLPVRERLRGRANVHRIPVNGGATEIGLANIGQWLGDGPWDVIHFNFGLHDAKFISATTQRASREEYVENLRTLVQHMKATKAKLVFATTTPVPKDGILQPGRVFDDLEARNQLAVRLMREEGVAIDDLHAVAKPALAEVGRPNDVHFTPAGYDLLADAVVASITGQLPEPNEPSAE